MKKFLASLLAVVLLAAMFVIPAAAETEALSIVVDADPEDNGWSREEADWTFVDPENGYWQSVPTTDASVEYVYQMRSDGEKLYVAVAINCALKEGGNGAGTNVRLWLKTNDEATVYTHFFDVYAGGFSAKKCGSLTANTGATVVTEEVGMNAAIAEIDGLTFAEFSFDLAKVNATKSFKAFICVSNKPADENVCLYFPAVTDAEDRKTNLPYTKWDNATDLEVSVADILMDGYELNVPTKVVNKNVALGKTYTGANDPDTNGDGVGDTYTAKLTDGVAANAGAYDNSWFGFWYNADSTNPSNAPEGLGTIIIDLEEVYNLTDIKVNVWNCNSSGIVAAKSITAFISEDGETYTEAGALNVPAVNDPAWATLEAEGSARYVKLVVETQGIWTFLNEIEIYADVEVEADEEDNSSSTPSTPVKPGDASNTIVFVLLAIVACAGSAVVIKTRK